MNKLIFRKLSADIFTFFLLSSLAITLIVWVIQGVNLLDIVSEKGHGLKVYFFYSILNIPKIFGKLLIFTYFLSIFVVLSRYEENNEILVFWTNGINKISFINFIGKISFLVVILQLLLNLIIIPYTQNLAQEYLRNSSIEFFPKLIQEKKFSNLSKNLTIFVEEYKKNGVLKGIYIKEKIKKNESKIIIANTGELLNNEYGYSFKLSDGKIINIDKKTILNLSFQETLYDISKLNLNIRKEKKLDETNTPFLISCIKKYFQERKNKKLRCGEGDTFLLRDIYEEIIKRHINPIYIFIISLLSSLTILKPKNDIKYNYYKSFLFLIGFTIIIFSELSYKLILQNLNAEILILSFPLTLIILFYCFILFKSKFNPVNL
tara:strand:- start:32 stop:1162 length:1131 start_codon:yes stop_codon:yes gene_type:complete